MNGDPLYYHGTWAGYAASIIARGFELGHEGRGHLLGRGVYLAQHLAAAALWTPSDLIITCALQPGTRILWLDEAYDRRVIRSLTREFGRQLLDLGPHFHQAIPSNKRLTQKELIHLCSYTLQRSRRRRWQTILRARKGNRVAYHDTWLRLSRLHGQLKRHGYDALGDRTFAHWDSDEIIVFNPARVRPISAHRLYRSGSDFDERFALSPPLTADTLAVLAAEAQAEEE